MTTAPVVVDYSTIQSPLRRTVIQHGDERRGQARIGQDRTGKGRKGQDRRSRRDC